MYARTAGWCADGVLRGRLCRVLQLRPPSRATVEDDRDAMITVNPTLVFKDAQIDMAHGAGGTASRRLVEALIAPLVGAHEPLNDAACVSVGDTTIAITTDSFVVRPLRFPGGSIGELAVNGTINDLAVA